MNINLENYLNYYLETDKPQFAVLINGKWGAGKTFYIKRKIENWNKLNKKGRNISLKPIYISLYGVSSVEEINLKIKETLNPLLYSKGAKIAKTILFGVINTATNISYNPGNEGKTTGNISFDINSLGLLKNPNAKVTGKKILVFDDLERVSMKISDVFGYINEFVEHYDCKVILLSDELNLKKKCEKEKEEYSTYKEKLIGQTFTIEANVLEATHSFLTIPSITEADRLKTSIDLIIDIFKASRIENLRILKQAIYDFVRFVKQFDKKINTHTNYNDFEISLLAHFLLVYFEYKSGNINVTELSFLNFSEKSKETETELRIKYDEVLEKYGVFRRQYVINYGLLIDFINNGVSNIPILLNELKQNGFFRELKEQPWERLWSWEELEDEEFSDIYKKVSNDFNNSKFNNPYVLLHVTCIFLSLIRDGMSKKTSSEIISSYKLQLDTIFKNEPNTFLEKFGDHSWQKVYRDRDTPEVKELLIYSNEKVLNGITQLNEYYTKNLFYLLNDESIVKLRDELFNPLPDRSTTYENSPVFSNLDGRLIAKQILKLKNKSIELFNSYLRKRYFPEDFYSNGKLELFHLKDNPCLVEIRQLLEAEAENLKPIKKRKIYKTIDLLKNINNKLDDLNI